MIANGEIDSNKIPSIIKLSAGGDSFVVIELRGVVNPIAKNLEEARGQVIASYQDYLEVEWVKELRKKYTVEVNEEVLYGLID